MMKILRVLPVACAAALAAAPLAAQPTPDVAHRAPGSTAAVPAGAVPGTQRYYFVPTGRTLPAGTVEVGDYQFLAPYVGYALHDRIMIAAGTPIIPGAFGRVWYFAPKVGLLARERWSAAVGGLVLASAQVDPLAGVDPREVHSLGWGVVTWSAAAGSITLGAASEGGAVSGVPDSWLVLTGAELRITRGAGDRTASGARALYEAYLAPAQRRPLEGVHVVGLRLANDRVAFEAAFPIIVERGETEVAPFPLLHMSLLF